MMKSLYKLTAIFCLFSLLIISSCDDIPTSVGSTILPPEDLITVYTDTFMMDASTIKLDSVFSKTSDFLLGEMYDPIYGNIKADVLCQLYCEEGFKFEYTPFEGKIDSVVLVIGYSYNSTGGLLVYGDSMAPMQISVFPVDKPLKRNYYSNDNPENYCNMNTPLGVKTFTAHDMTVPDSVRNALATDGYGNLYRTYVPRLRIKLPVELGQKIYDETINNPSSFASQNAFNEFFPGIYITNTFGSGCLLKTTTDYMSMLVYYKNTVKDSNGNDSLRVWWDVFTSSKEVIQMNRFKNSNIDQLLEKTPTHTYIKSPAGVCTKLVIPTTEITKKLNVNDRYVNGFNLELKYLPEDEWAFAYSPPSHLLVIPEDSVKTFFETGMIDNNVSSFVSYKYDISTSTRYTSSYNSAAGYNSNTRTYSFGNISSLLKLHMDKNPDKDLNLLVLPVIRTIPSNSSAGYLYSESINSNFDLSGVKIRTEGDYMKVVVLSSKFENK